MRIPKIKRPFQDLLMSGTAMIILSKLVAWPYEDDKINNVGRLSSPELRGCQLTILSRGCGGWNEDAKD